MIFHLLARLFFILVGYGLASIASGIVVGVIYFWSDLAKQPSFFGLMSEIIFFCTIVAYFIAIFAALPALAVVLCGEWRALRSLGYYAVAGCLIGVALPIVVGFKDLIAVGLACGPVAGAIFWRVAGRNAGFRPVQ
ncbi:MAG: hypothetical protein H7X89_11670 [Rhizobiales bacterium]|nr:hypothetical protein [Hyphomicrobiales bacterium]